MANIEAVTGEPITHPIRLEVNDNKATRTLQGGAGFSGGSAIDNNHLPRPQILLGDRLPRPPVDVAIKNSLGDRHLLDILQQL